MVFIMNTENRNENNTAIAFDPIDGPAETIIADLTLLAQRVEYLVDICGKLTGENCELRAQVDAAKSECIGLRETNERLRTRVDAMVIRLKNLEPNS